MWRLEGVQKSDQTGKKWKALFSREGATGGRKMKTTHFGDASKEDYTQHHDEARRERYRLRHWKGLDTHDPTRAGFLSYFLLRGDSTSLEANIAVYKRKFGL